MEFIDVVRSYIREMEQYNDLTEAKETIDILLSDVITLEDIEEAIEINVGRLTEVFDSLMNIEDGEGEFSKEEQELIDNSTLLSLQYIVLYERIKMYKEESTTTLLN